MVPETLQPTGAEYPAQTQVSEVSEPDFPQRMTVAAETIEQRAESQRHERDQGKPAHEDDVMLHGLSKSVNAKGASTIRDKLGIRLKLNHAVRWARKPIL